jgi:hypothetical protein
MRSGIRHTEIKYINTLVLKNAKIQAFIQTAKIIEFKIIS